MAIENYLDRVRKEKEALQKRIDYLKREEDSFNSDYIEVTNDITYYDRGRVYIKRKNFEGLIVKANLKWQK